MRSRDNLFTRTKITVSITGVLLIVLGAAIFANPAGTLNLVTILLGWALIIVGACLLLETYTRHKEGMSRGRVAGGIIVLLIGIAIVLYPAFFVSYVISLLGIFVLLTGISDCLEANLLRHMGFESWIVAMVLGGITVGAGILLLSSPFTFAEWATMLAGGVLIYDGATELMSAVRMDKDR